MSSGTPMGRRSPTSTPATTRTMALVIRNVVHLSLVEYLPPCASHTKPLCALAHREKAASPSSRHPHHSERPTRRRRWRAPPVRSKKRDIPMGRRYRVDAKASSRSRTTLLIPTAVPAGRERLPSKVVSLPINKRQKTATPVGAKCATILSCGPIAPASRAAPLRDGDTTILSW